MRKQHALNILFGFFALILFLYLTSPFLVPRIKTFSTAAKTLANNHLPAAYQNNNRYFPIVKLTKEQPNARLVYIYENTDSSWFHIQLVYEAYPKIPEDILYSDIVAKKFNLSTLPAGTIVASLHDIPELKNKASKQFFSKEYYLYVIK